MLLIRLCLEDVLELMICAGLQLHLLASLAYLYHFSKRRGM